MVLTGWLRLRPARCGEPIVDGGVIGQLPFFIGYLKQGGLFDGWVPDCLLLFTRPNAPRKRDVVDTRWTSNPIRSICVRIPLWVTWMRALVCARIPQ